MKLRAKGKRLKQDLDGDISKMDEPGGYMLHQLKNGDVLGFTKSIINAYNLL